MQLSLAYKISVLMKHDKDGKCIKIRYENKYQLLLKETVLLVFIC